MDNITACGRKVPGEIPKRWPTSLEDFIAHSTQPNGFMVPDRRRQRRTCGPRSAYAARRSRRCEVFDGGYVYGRTAWDKPESAFYSIRFGPGLKFHGHEDHLGVTYYAQGRDVLVDAGFHSYEKSAYRDWTHVPRGAQHAGRGGRALPRRDGHTLVRSSIGAGPADVPADRQGLWRAAGPARCWSTTART